MEEFVEIRLVAKTKTAKIELILNQNNNNKLRRKRKEVILCFNNDLILEIKELEIISNCNISLN